MADKAITNIYNVSDELMEHLYDGTTFTSVKVKDETGRIAVLPVAFYKELNLQKGSRININGQTLEVV